MGSAWAGCNCSIPLWHFDSSVLSQSIHFPFFFSCLADLCELYQIKSPKRKYKSGTILIQRRHSLLEKSKENRSLIIKFGYRQSQTVFKQNGYGHVYCLCCWTFKDARFEITWWKWIRVKKQKLFSCLLSLSHKGTRGTGHAKETE